MNPWVFTYVRCLINALHISFFPGQLKLLRVAGECEEGGSEEEYTSFFNKRLSWESRILAFLVFDFRLEDRKI